MIYNTAVIGAGAAGLVCAAKLNKNNNSVLLIDHADTAGKKLLISGGGKANFSNYNISYERYISANPHFCKSALSRFGVDHMLKHIYSGGVEFEEREHGQLFTVNGAKELLNLLLNNCSGVTLRLRTEVESIEKEKLFFIKNEKETFYASNLVIATGGMSYPQLGATGFGLEIGKKFGHKIVPPKPALVPFTVADNNVRNLMGVNLDVSIKCGDMSFNLPMVFTHKGLSGPAVLQISNYWSKGAPVYINFAPATNIKAYIRGAANSKTLVRTKLYALLPKNLVTYLLPTNLLEQKCASISKDSLETLEQIVHKCEIKPSGTEGYKKAEVMQGGVSVEHLSSTTMESSIVNNLYFVGEVMDVTGELGGYNLHWAYASAMAAAEAILKK